MKNVYCDFCGQEVCVYKKVNKLKQIVTLIKPHSCGAEVDSSDIGSSSDIIPDVGKKSVQILNELPNTGMRSTVNILENIRKKLVVEGGD